MGRRSRHSKKKVGKCVKLNKQRFNTEELDEVKNAPHSFVFHRGSVGENVEQLTKDFRKVMEPYTASSLKARKANKIKDFLSISGILHVSHLCIFTVTKVGTYLKLGRVPRGPTLYFKVLNYCLARDVISSLKKQLVFQKQFQHSPLVILNNFGGDNVELKLIASMFQNMFPSINLTRVNLNNVRRCVLINYNTEQNEIDFRHYSIKVVPVGISKGVKKIMQSKVPNLAQFEDISEFITKSNLLSESEADDPNSHVTLPQKISSRGNAPAAQSSIRLVEQGPRITLKLVKIEEGFMEGEVLYHSLKVKTEEEKDATIKTRLEKRSKKQQVTKYQEERRKLNKDKKEALKKKSLKGMEKKTEEESVDADDEDDSAWYRREVGKEPEQGLFATNKGQKRKIPFHEFIKSKRSKPDPKQQNQPNRTARDKGSKNPKILKHSVQKGGRGKERFGNTNQKSKQPGTKVGAKRVFKRTNQNKPKSGGKNRKKGKR